MLRLATTTVTAAVCLFGGMCLARAQATPGPTPGPTNPSLPGPQAKPGATMVVNPTEEECRKGWSPTLKWTKEQVEQFCAQLKASK
jgi:hypothetical protein